MDSAELDFDEDGGTYAFNDVDDYYLDHLYESSESEISSSDSAESKYDMEDEIVNILSEIKKNSIKWHYENNGADWGTRKYYDRISADLSMVLSMVKIDLHMSKFSSYHAWRRSFIGSSVYDDMFGEDDSNDDKRISTKYYKYD